MAHRQENNNCSFKLFEEHRTGTYHPHERTVIDEINLFRVSIMNYPQLLLQIVKRTDSRIKHHRDQETGQYGWCPNGIHPNRKHLPVRRVDDWNSAHSIREKRQGVRRTHSEWHHHLLHLKLSQRDVTVSTGTRRRAIRPMNR